MGIRTSDRSFTKTHSTKGNTELKKRFLWIKFTIFFYFADITMQTL